MIRLEADFESDLRDHARNWLQQTWGTDAKSIPQEDVLIRFFDVQRRLPSQRPRTVLMADTFSCPSSDEIGLNLLLEKVRRGDDIQTHLSIKHSDSNNQDGLLNDWGICHFHVGIGLHPSKKKFNARSGGLLFALVRDELFCAIGMYTHRDWTNTEVVETLHRNWPNFINQFRLKHAAAEPLTGAQKINLRSCNANVITGVQDGTVYMPLSGGITPAGTSVQAVMLAAREVENVRVLQANLPILCRLRHANTEKKRL